MTAFIQAKGLTAEYARFTRTYQCLGGQITFQTAFDRAMYHLAARPTQPPSTDLQHLEQAVAVEAGAAHVSFNLLNSARRSVEMAASYLASVQQLGAYQQWAASHAASVARKPSQLTDSEERAAAHDRRAVQLGWDSAQSAQAQQYPPTPEPGTAVAHGPYSSSWWNSYADPYYDLSGYPGNDPALKPGAPPPDYGSTGAPSHYGWATQGYSRNTFPMYAELGPNAVPSFGMFPGGAAGGASFGGSSGAR